MPLIIHNLQLDLGMKIMSELSKIDRFDASWSSIEKREGSTLMQLKSMAMIYYFTLIWNIYHFSKINGHQILMTASSLP